MPRSSEPIALPFDTWPTADREAWLRATAPSQSLFDEAAAAHNLRPATIELYLEQVANWLGFLKRRGDIDGTDPAFSGLHLITPERLDAYVQEQRDRANRPGTIRKRLEGLHAAARLMAPDLDVGFILTPGGQRLSRVLPATARPVDIRSPEEVLGHVWDLHREGLAGRGYGRGVFALRDAALICVFATRAPRRGSVARMQLGHHLRMQDGRYHVLFEAQDTKNGRSLDYPLPEDVTPIIDAYLDVARPRLNRGRNPMVWLDKHGQGLAEREVSDIVCNWTRRWFGVGRGPHWLRKCFTTTISLTAPERLLDAAFVLGHGPEVQLQHYNMAKPIMAAQRHTAVVLSAKARTRLLAKRAFGRS